jgi:hypothetical protein
VIYGKLPPAGLKNWADGKHNVSGCRDDFEAIDYSTARAGEPTGTIAVMRAAVKDAG